MLGPCRRLQPRPRQSPGPPSSPSLRHIVCFGLHGRCRPLSERGTVMTLSGDRRMHCHLQSDLPTQAPCLKQMHSPVSQEAIGPWCSPASQLQSTQAQHADIEESAAVCMAAKVGAHEAQKKGPPADGRPEAISAMHSPTTSARSAAQVHPQTACCAFCQNSAGPKQMASEHLSICGGCFFAEIYTSATQLF